MSIAKYVSFFVLFAFGLGALGLFVQAQTGFYSTLPTKGYWKLYDQRSEYLPHQGSPYKVLKIGDIPLFQVQIIDEENTASIDWYTPAPPSMLIPGTFWTCHIQGLINRWEISSLLYSNVNIKFQPIDADCCEEGTIVYAKCHLSPGKGDRLKEAKQTSHTVAVPQLGLFGSETSGKFQIRYNVIQAGGSFESVYAYQWISEQAQIQIELQINRAAAKVNDELKLLDSPPYIKSSRTYVPFRFIGESFGAKLDFALDPNTGKTREVSYELNQDQIVFNLLTQEMFKNGQLIKDAPQVEIQKQRLMVPLRVLSENLGAQVEWIATTQEVKVIKRW